MPDLAPSLHVDLSACSRNARSFRDQIGVPLLPMVKADGYGLGAVAVARALDTNDLWGFGVATPREAAELRAAGIKRPIVAFLPFVPALLEDYRRQALRPVIGDLNALQAWLAQSDGPFHLEIDTGMGRAGFRWDDADAIAALGERLHLVGDQWEGIATHFHSSDTDSGATAAQWSRFEDVLRGLGRVPRLVHAANSAAGQYGRRYAGTLARPGIYLYGGGAGSLQPEQVVRLEATVVAVRRIPAGEPVSYGASHRLDRETVVATLGIGYADGVPRRLGNRGQVELHNQLAPIVGRVTMDMTMVAVPDGDVAVGATATLFGGRISLDQQARDAETISYQILTSLGRRVVRHYSGGP